MSLRREKNPAEVRRDSPGAEERDSRGRGRSLLRSHQDRSDQRGAAWKNLTTDKIEGGSTLTQQLTKNLFLSKEQTTRKVNEWILALQIERYYTKNQIASCTSTTVSWRERVRDGSGSGNVFWKAGKRSDTGRGSIARRHSQRPSDYSPTSNPAKAKERRDLVLDLMAKNGFCSQLMPTQPTKPIQLADTAYYQGQRKSSPFDYPVEYIRPISKMITRLA